VQYGWLQLRPTDSAIMRVKLRKILGAVRREREREWFRRLWRVKPLVHKHQARGRWPHSTPKETSAQLGARRQAQTDAWYEEPNYLCCGTTFESQEDFDAHMASAHPAPELPVLKPARRGKRALAAAAAVVDWLAEL
jgi:hypothetical protein